MNGDFFGGILSPDKQHSRDLTCIFLFLRCTPSTSGEAQWISKAKLQSEVARVQKPVAQCEVEGGGGPPTRVCRRAIFSENVFVEVFLDDFQCRVYLCIGSLRD